MQNIVRASAVRLIMDKIPYHPPSEIISIIGAKTPSIIDLLRNCDLIVGQSAPSITLILPARDVPGMYICPRPECKHLFTIVSEQTFNLYDPSIDLRPLKSLASREPRYSEMRHILSLLTHSRDQRKYLKSLVEAGEFTEVEAQAIARSPLYIPTLLPGDLMIGTVYEDFDDPSRLEKCLKKAKILKAFPYYWPTRIAITRDYFGKLFIQLYAFTIGKTPMPNYSSDRPLSRSVRGDVQCERHRRP